MLLGAAGIRRPRLLLPSRARRDPEALAALAEADRVTSFDAYRARVLALPEATAAASPARREELCRLVVEPVVVRDRQLHSIGWRRLLGRSSRKDGGSAPKGARGPLPLSDDDPLAWYVA